MTPHFRMPTHPLRGLSGLLRVALLLAIGLCAFVHGPSGEPDRPEPAAVAVSAPVASGGPPHGPHRHPGAAECSDDAVRTSGQAAAQQQPPAEAGTAGASAAAVGAGAALGRPQAHGRPYRFRTRRTGRAALVRTSRWRI